METININDIDFIYDDQEQAITIMVRILEVNSQYQASIKICSIIYDHAWILNTERYNNNIEAIIHTINKMFNYFLTKDIVYYKPLIDVLSDAMNEAKKLRFQPLDLFDDGSTRKTYRVSKPIHKPIRRKDKSRVSIFD